MPAITGRSTLSLHFNQLEFMFSIIWTKKNNILIIFYWSNYFKYAMSVKHLSPILSVNVYIDIITTLIQWREKNPYMALIRTRGMMTGSWQPYWFSQIYLMSLTKLVIDLWKWWQIGHCDSCKLVVMQENSVISKGQVCPLCGEDKLFRSVLSVTCVALNIFGPIYSESNFT